VAALAAAARTESANPADFLPLIRPLAHKGQRWPLAPAGERREMLSGQIWPVRVHRTAYRKPAHRKRSRMVTDDGGKPRMFCFQEQHQ
jgi:hypothetical protein